MDKSVSLARMLLVLAMVTLTASFSALSFADACPSETSTAEDHVANSRATSSGAVCSSCTDDTCCKNFGAEGYHTSFGSSYCYYTSFVMKLSHSCMNDETTYTSTGGDDIASTGTITLYQGDNGNWYDSDPADCGSGGGGSPPPSPSPAASFTLTSGSGSDGSGVRPNIILAMNDSFLMNSEILWAAASGNTEPTDLSNVGTEMFINPRATRSSNAGYTKGAGYEALYSGYNSLAFDPTVTYLPWPGIDPTTGEAYADRHFACYYRDTSSDASNTTNENKYCAKYFPEYDNTLTGANCSSLNSNSATATTKHCVLRDCQQGGEVSGLHGCKEFVPLNPTTTYKEFGQLLEQNISSCKYTYPYTLGGTKDCLSLEAWIHYYPAFPHGDATPTNSITGHCSSCNLDHIKNCNNNVLTTDFCTAIQDMDFPAPDYQGVIQTFNPFSYTCYNLNQNGQAHCQLGDGVITRSYTNILRKFDLVSHRYTVMEGGTLVSKVVAEQSSDIQKNYANWFTYHRTLGHIQKGAMLAAAYEAKDNDRIGIADSTGVTNDIATLSSGRTTISTAIARKSAAFTNLNNKMLSTIDNTYAHLKNNNQYLYNTMSSPIDTSDSTANCRQNHILMFASGEWNEPSVIASLSGTPDNLANMADYAYKSDIGASIENFVPTDDYSDQNIQHLKTWVMQFDINSDTDFDYGSYDSSNHCNAPTNTSTAADKRTDTCHSAYAGRGGYRRIEHAANAMDDASDLLSLMTSGGTMCPDESDCSETVGKRISWKELKKQ